jgi:hypothetical protein
VRIISYVLSVSIAAAKERDNYCNVRDQEGQGSKVVIVRNGKGDVAKKTGDN